MRILIVEDNFIVAWDLKRQLDRLGCEAVGPVACVEDALAQIEAELPQGAILDHGLRDEDSVPVAMALHERGIPSVFLTGHSHLQGLPEALEHVPMVAKPVGPGDLERIVASLRERGGGSLERE